MEDLREWLTVITIWVGAILVVVAERVVLTRVSSGRSLTVIERKHRYGVKKSAVLGEVGKR